MRGRATTAATETEPKGAVPDEVAGLKKLAEGLASSPVEWGKGAAGHPFGFAQDRRLERSDRGRAGDPMAVGHGWDVCGERFAAFIVLCRHLVSFSRQFPTPLSYPSSRQDRPYADWGRGRGTENSGEFQEGSLARRPPRRPALERLMLGKKLSLCLDTPLQALCVGDAARRGFARSPEGGAGRRGADAASLPISRVQVTGVGAQSKA